MEYGPYLLFLRSNIVFSDYHDFEDWAFVAGALGRQMWGETGLVTMFSTPADLAPLADLADIPDWVEFLEVATVSLDFASCQPTERKRVITAYGRNMEFGFSEAEEYFPTVANMMLTSSPGAIPDKPTFDKRLLLIFFSEPEEFVNERIVKVLRKRLGSQSAGIWHSRDIHAIAFMDRNSPAEILQSLTEFCEDESVFDIGIFRLLGGVPLFPPVSPLQAFLAP